MQHQCKNSGANEVLKNEHTWAHFKNWKVVQKESSFSRNLQYSQKNYDLACIFLRFHKVYKSCPGANLHCASDFENAPHYTMMNVHKLLVYARFYFLHHCFAPSCSFNKARCSIWLLLCIQTACTPLKKKIHNAVQKEWKNISPKGRWRDDSKAFFNPFQKA